MNNFWSMVLPYGEENAIHQKDLAKRLDMKPDKLKASIKAARINGIEICSTHAGYFLPKDDYERRRFVIMQEKQAKTRFKTSKAIRKSLCETKGQMEMAEVQGDMPNERK